MTDQAGKASTSTSTSTSTSETARFRRQHEELTRLASELFGHLVIPELERDARPAAVQLAKLIGALKVHAAMENEALYPRLRESPSAPIREKASELLHEVGDIYQRTTEFARRWGSASAIAAEPQAFVAETLDVLRTLGRRIKREERELYPMIEALEGARA